MANKKLVEELISTPFVDNYAPKHQLGPDYVIPTTDNRTWLPEGAIQIAIPKNLDMKYQPVSLVTLLETAVKNSPEKFAMVVNRKGTTEKWTYLQYLNDVRTIAKGFIKLGLLPYHGLSILSSNSPEWLISYLAAIFCGGFPAGIYTTNSPDACNHILNDCSANIVLVENEFHLEKILGIRSKLPNLKAIVQIQGLPTHPEVVSWQDLYLIGKSLPNDVLDRRIRGLAINQCCNLVYTSGTTGNPKGVMLSHDSLIMTTKCTVNEAWHIPLHGTILSYLPLSHVAAVFFDISLAILTESTVNFSSPNALRGSLIEDLIEAKPTVFLGVPRVYEKLKEQLQHLEESLSPTKKKLLAWAREQALTYHQNKAEDSKLILYLAAKEAILDSMKAAVGLEKSEYFICGAAPIPIEIINFFLSYDLVLSEAFGLSESSGAHMMNFNESYRLGSVGNINSLSQYFETKILKSENDDDTGEIMLRGRHIFMGYLNMEKLTKETVEEDKWIHTGDIGKLDEDGFLFIVGRIKELIITAGGLNIPSGLIENHIKKLLPVVSNCMLVGDKRKYLTILLTLNTEVNSGTLEPTDELNLIALKWCESNGSSVKSVSEILQTKDAKVSAAIQKGIDTYNENLAISRPHRIQKWAILPQDFCVHNGTIGPTSKLKRSFVCNKYASIIENMYSS